MRFLGCLLYFGALSAASAGQLRDLRLWDSPEGTRVVLELTDATPHKVFTLDDPARIVVDLPGITGAGLANKVGGKGVISHVRAAQREEGLRIVLDMSKAIQPHAVLLDPAEQYGYRLVLDLAGPGDEGAPEAASTVMSKADGWTPRPIIVAIDAGHGGEDPGAIGHSGLMEKDVALTLARKLASMVNQEPGFKAVLTRDGDYFIPLRDRVKRARKAQADLFVSIHANALKNRSMRGSAVYVVSPRGATSEHARWLAQKENSADLVGGVGLHDKDDELAAVLIDLSQSSTMEASFDVGARMLKQLGTVNVLQRQQVQQAAFMVLKAPDIPSVLVETAFITNSEEERLLRDPAGQEKLVRSLLEGIKGYFESYRPREQRPPADGPRLQKVRSGSADEPKRRASAE
jgi:N-acetylmuramoyl-L-alanine amidase